MKSNFTKIYKKDGFSARIELNLAEISASPDDEFSLVKTFYVPSGFTCELCGHKNCLYAFTIKNNKTQIEMTVGSECIHHFKDKGIDIDLAEGLMKRVMKATAEARDMLREELGKAAWEALPEEEKKTVRSWMVHKKIEELGKEAMKKMPLAEKAKKTVEAYMVVQAIELLSDVSRNKHTLSKEEIENIVSLGLEDKLQNAQKKAAEYAIYEEGLKLNREASKYVSNLYATKQPVDDSIVNSFIDRAKALASKNQYTHLLHNIQSSIDSYKAHYSTISQFSWLRDCQIEDPVILSLKAYLNKYNTLTPAQVELGKKIVSGQNQKKDEEFENALHWLLENNKTDFVESVSNFYSTRKFVSSKQRYMIMKLYGINHG